MPDNTPKQEYFSMPFQFRCPQGHLLEGENEDVGQIVNCPVCGTPLTIPSAPYAPTAAPVTPPVSTSTVPTAEIIAPPPLEVEPEAEPLPDVGQAQHREEEDIEGFAIHTGDETPEADDHVPDFESGNANQDELHIPCPNGHVLAVTRDMLDEEALCPFCDEQFELKERHSQEAIEKRELQAEKREEKQERVYLYWGIGIMVLGIISVITFIIIYNHNS